MLYKAKSGRWKAIVSLDTVGHSVWESQTAKLGLELNVLCQQIGPGWSSQLRLSAWEIKDEIQQVSKRNLNKTTGQLVSHMLWGPGTAGKAMD